MYFTSKRIDIPYDVLYDCYATRRLSIRECAKELGYGRAVIWNALRRSEIPLREKLRTPKFVFDRQWLEEMYMHRHMSLTECGNLAGCSSSTIGFALKQFGIPTRPFQTPPTGATKGWLIENYVHKQLSMQQCADILGCDVESIRTALQRHNISARPYVRDGPNNHQWRGGVSYLPYCSKWTEKLRESIRDNFGRKCFICSMNEVGNGRKLSVHHVNFDKMSGCYGKQWNLVALCHKCHTKTTNSRFEYFNLLINHWAYKYTENGIYTWSL